MRLEPWSMREASPVCEMDGMVSPTLGVKDCEPAAALNSRVPVPGTTSERLASDREAAPAWRMDGLKPANPILPPYVRHLRHL